MNYEDMTDTQIDGLVRQKTGRNKDYTAVWDKIYTFNLMLSNKIDLVWVESHKEWNAGMDVQHPEHGHLAIVTQYSENPLRAICIVFLMMHDALEELEQ